MNPLIPIIFSALSVFPSIGEGSSTPQIELDGAIPVQMLADVDTIRHGSIELVIGDAVAENGGSRRFIKTQTTTGEPIDIMDGGSWGMEGFFDRLYYTDRKRETLSAVITVADADPSFNPAPEGGVIIELTDRIVLRLINHDAAESVEYVLRDNQVKVKVDDSGHFRLESIRPKPNDLETLTRHIAVYDLYAEHSDEPLDARQFNLLMLKTFPIPRK